MDLSHPSPIAIMAAGFQPVNYDHSAFTQAGTTRSAQWPERKDGSEQSHRLTASKNQDNFYLRNYGPEEAGCPVNGTRLMTNSALRSPFHESHPFPSPS